MKVLCTTQGTEEWYRARAGHVTASNMARVIANRGAKGRQGYLLDLVLDMEGVDNWQASDPPPWFQHGHQWEDWARGWYEYHQDVDVERTGFCEHDDVRWLGCSPDGLTPDVYLEIKSHKSLTQWRQAVARISRPYLDQCQAGMLVTGHRVAHLLHYWRNDETGELLERGHVHTIHADPARQDFLLERSVDFYQEALAYFRRRNPRREPRIGGR